MTTNEDHSDQHSNRPHSDQHANCPQLLTTGTQTTEGHSQWWDKKNCTTIRPQKTPIGHIRTEAHRANTIRSTPWGDMLQKALHQLALCSLRRFPKQNQQRKVKVGKPRGEHSTSRCHHRPRGHTSKPHNQQHHPTEQKSK